LKIITLEEHFLNSAIIGAARKAMGSSYLDVFKSPDDLARLRQIQDIGEGRLADMDADGIDVQVLNPQETNMLPAAEAVSLARNANDQLADAVRAHPDRFAGFATLPTPDPEAAAAELERAVTRLGFKGAMIMGRTAGLFLDDPRFRPILEAASALDVPIYLHPAPPPEAVQDAYYRGGLDPAVSSRFATGAWGWHLETGIHALHLILAGVFDEFPNLQLILGHWGEMIPFYLSRFDGFMIPAVTKLKRRISDYFMNNVYVTPSGMYALPQLQLTMQVIGVDRILYAADYPYLSNKGAREFLEQAPISPADKEKIAHGNAEKLLKL
jgi:predicted TIM-barrel fold metal-dependent hydrolase